MGAFQARYQKITRGDDADDKVYHPREMGQRTSPKMPGQFHSVMINCL